MQIAAGKVIGRRVELDADLPEGASVTVLALEGDETFEADPETEKMLLEAIEQCSRGHTTPMEQVLSESGWRKPGGPMPITGCVCKSRSTWLRLADTKARFG